MFYADNIIKFSSTGSSSRKLTMRRLSFSVLIFACARRAANTAQRPPKMKYERFSLCLGSLQPATALSVWLEFALALIVVLNSAHALPSRRSGLDGSFSGDGLDYSAVGGERELHPEHWNSLPPTPSDALIAEMKKHNAAFDYTYPFWNVTRLHAESCRHFAEQQNDEAARSADRETLPCIPTYSCEFDRFRYPHWLLYASCSTGPGPCLSDGVELPPSLYRCLAYEEDILLLRYVKVSRTTTDDRNVVGAMVDEAGNGDVEKPIEVDKDGEWKLWFFQVPSYCNCLM